FLCSPDAPARGRPGFLSKGIVRLSGASVVADVNFSGGRFKSPAFAAAAGSTPSAVAIEADTLEVGAQLIFGETGNGSIDRFKAKGQVRLVNARIAGDLLCQNARFDFPSEYALLADGISVAQATFLGAGLWTNGYLGFTQAKLREGVYADGIVFDCTLP